MYVCMYIYKYLYNYIYMYIVILRLVYFDLNVVKSCHNDYGWM